MTFEPIQISDLPQITPLTPEGWDDITIKVTHYIDSAFCFPIKLVVNHKIVAIGATIVHEHVAWLGHIIVDPSERGKGYGKIMTNELIRIAQLSNCTSIQLIATDMGAPVYAKIGFQESTSYLFFEGISHTHPEEPDNNILPYQSNFKQALLALDHAITAEYRECEIEPHLQSAYVYADNNTVSAYYLPTLGEGFIASNEPHAGIALLKLHLKQNSKVVLPKENTIAISFLTSQGYRVKREAKRMYLGDHIDVQFQYIFNRIGGNIG